MKKLLSILITLIFSLSVVTANAEGQLTLAFASLTDGEYDFSQTVADSVAVDGGNASRLDIYANNKLIKTALNVTSGESVDFEVEDKIIGHLVIKAVAMDETGVASSVSVTLNVMEKSEEEAYNNPLSKEASGWKVLYDANSSSSGITDSPDGGKAYGITVAKTADNNAPAIVPQDQCSIYAENITMSEHDFMISSTEGINVTLMRLVDEKNANINGATISGGMIGEYPIEANKWYHFVYNIDPFAKTCNVSVSDILEDGSYGEPEQLTSHSFANLGTIKTIRFAFQPLTENEVSGYFRNYKITTVKSRAHIMDIIPYYDGIRMSAENGQISPDADCIQIDISETLLYTTILRDNAELYANGKRAGNYDVCIGAYDEQDFENFLGQPDDADKSANKITMRFNRPLAKDTDYTIVLTCGIKTASGAKLSVPVYYNFRTSSAGGGIDAWSLVAEGKGEIKYPSQLNGGETVMLSAFYDDSFSYSGAKLLFYVYSGDRLVALTATDLEPSPLTSSGEITLPDNLSDVTLYGQIWDGFDEMNTLSQNFVMTDFE
ncbi:MAG: hypothetical protein J6B23_06485 [Clostridia bacterium]|nr:hypothetical protein [Clostridia bacterium]